MGFLNSTVLDWAIGIIFVYLLLAIICTTINEWIAGVFGIRSTNLAKAITQLLDAQKGTDPTQTFLQEFYAHPLITGMMAPGKNPDAAHPSYLPSRTFATTIIDLVTHAKQGAVTFNDFQQGVQALPPGDVRTALLALMRNAAGDLDRAQKNVEEWFDDTMERASGWYKRRTELVTVCIALLLVVGTNADTIRIARILWTNNTDRTVIAEKAKACAENSANMQSKCQELNQNESQTLRSVLSWPSEDESNPEPWHLRLLGWFLSVVAISLGAPFWFDLLNKLMNIRNAGKKPAKGDSQPDDRTTTPPTRAPASSPNPALSPPTAQ
jgi:hypothetical protein